MRVLCRRQHYHSGISTSEYQMPRCHVCHDSLPLPNECNYCGEYYCTNHRLPENHQCPHLEQAHTLGPEFRAAVRTSPIEERTSSRVKRGIGITIVLLLVVVIVLLV
ncbi:AN1-type zinc finger domain-containing protein [Natrialbaceae archaeon A-CW3]